MLRRLSSLSAIASAVLLASVCRASPDDDIPKQWRKSVLLIWDYTYTRYLNEPAPNLATYSNWTLEQIIDGNGTINVCMQAHFAEWLDWLPGHDNFPLLQVDINMIGWAVRDRVLLQGSIDGFDVHVGFTDDADYPTCNPGCSRAIHPDGDYSGCPGGPDRRFHQFLHLDPSFGTLNMGAASGPGVSISLSGWETIGSKDKPWPMLTHEIGHTFGFPDFLDDYNRFPNRTTCDILWMPANAPAKFVMNPGSGGADMPEKLTDMEGYMLRHWWSRFSRLRGWQSDNVTWPSPLECDKPAVEEKRDVELTSRSVCQLV
ncbi:hypothetical protein CEP54_012924 [Fusarium duplospermum]|uniref:Uncharacterized protein n=1 Tax=Fusarium duplospermum TaxID=1325734 RepID=A0A428P682_9HYPO|nr:hypothetical protein CEP54_012924 [Fusarium duplospermum]